MNENKENIIIDKSYSFALRIIKLYKYLCDDKKEYVLSKQVLRSGTSIGANVEEAIGGITKKDFLNKMFNAYKEARETNYWIRLLKDAEILESKIAFSLLKDCDIIIKILGKIISTSRKDIVH